MIIWKKDDLRNVVTAMVAVGAVVTTGAVLVGNLTVVVSEITMLAVDSAVFATVEVSIVVSAVESLERNVLY